MLRQALLTLSRSDAMQRLVTGWPAARRMARRFVAGETLEDAMAACRALNAQGLAVTLDYLGEAVTERREAEAAGAMAIRILEAIRREGVEANLSLKPSQMGLDIDERFCYDNVARVLERARQLGDGQEEIFVCLDMESSAYTDRTLDLTERLVHAGFRNVGTVLQAYLRRTPNDLERMLRLGVRLRLVKGAYLEPSAIAYPDKADVDRAYVELMRILLERGHYPAIATHDERIIEATRRWAFERGIAKTSFEFQMLYGIRRDLQQRLREEGYNVRVYVPFGEQWYPYLMRRLAERPANLVFVVGNVVRERPLDWRGPAAFGAGVMTGIAAAWWWRTDHRR